MINIRRGCFETNSSSCHSIYISKTSVKDYYNRKIDFYFDSFGWSEDKCYNTGDYLYTAIVIDNSPENVKKYLNKLKSILDKYSIRYTFEPYEVVHSNWGRGMTTDWKDGYNFALKG